MQTIDKSIAFEYHIVRKLTKGVFRRKGRCRLDKIVGMEIKCLNNLVKRYHCSSLLMKECDNLTGTHGFILGYLAEMSDKQDVFQKDVEKRFDIRRSTASEILNLMERNGLIVRESVDYDARLKKIVLTDKAKDLCERIDEQFAETENMLTKGISEEELGTFFAVIDKMKANISESIE